MDSERPMKIYDVRCDGKVICCVVLYHEDYKDQASRDTVRKKIATTYGVPSHYFRFKLRKVI